MRESPSAEFANSSVALETGYQLQSIAGKQARTCPLKIAHVADSMEMGGAEKLTAMLCRMQRDQGHDPAVHCLYALGVLGEELRGEGFDVTLYNRSSFLALAKALYSAFKHDTPDVVHCHNATAAILAAIPARLAGVKSVIVTRHGLVKPPYQLRREVKFAIASRCCDWIVGVCEGTRTNLLQAPLAARKKIVRVYNGAPPANLETAPQPKSRFTLLYVGRLAAPKDHPTLLQAVALMRKSHPNVELWMVGGGPSEGNLRQLAVELGLADCVTFFGEQMDVSQFLVAADLFVMSSVTEGLPVSLLEAMSAGLPALVTDVGGMGEIARLSGAAILVPASEPEAMARALCEAAEHPQRLREMGTQARRCYQTHFQPRRMVGRYMDLYRKRRVK